MSPAAPYLLLAGFLAVLGSYVGGNIQGRNAEQKTWRLVIAEQKADAARQLAGAEAARAAQERAYNAFKDEVEKRHVESEKRISEPDTANRKLVARLGLYDSQGRGRCRADAVPGDSASAGDAAEPAAGCRLSDSASQALLDLARDADRVAAYAAACHLWAVTLPGGQ
jgi:hypothetical protein